MKRRAFFALFPPEELRAELHAAAREAFASERSVRVVAPANLHLTLAFLGDVEEDLVLAFADQLEPFAPTELSIEAGSKPRAFGASALALEVRDRGERLVPYVFSLRKALTRAGLPGAEARAYRPHLTIARRRGGPQDGPPILRRDLTWRAERVSLVFSELEPAGAVYTVARER